MAQARWLQHTDGLIIRRPSPVTKVQPQTHRVDTMTILLILLTSLLAAILVFAVMLLPSRYVKHSPATKESTRVHVLVLGDIGRSPRMNYHARSIARHGGYVDLIGYDGKLWSLSGTSRLRADIKTT